MARIQLFNTEIGTVSHEACSFNVGIGTYKVGYGGFKESFKEYCSNRQISNEKYEYVLDLFENYIKASGMYYMLIPVGSLGDEVLSARLYIKHMSTLLQPYSIIVDKRVFTELSTNLLYSMYNSDFKETGIEYDYLVLEVWENDKVIQFADRTVFFHSFYSMRGGLYGITCCSTVDGVLEYGRDDKEVFI